MQSQKSCKYVSEDAITEWAKGCKGKEAEFIKSIASILHKDYKTMSFKAFEDKIAWDADEYEVSFIDNISFMCYSFYCVVG